MNNPYEEEYWRTRFFFDERRELLWRILCESFFNPRLRDEDTVLELGAGYGHFINNVRGKRKIAVDLWQDFPRFLKAGVESHVGAAADLDFIEDGAIDFAFASNLFEHLTQMEFRDVLAKLRRKLGPRGRLMILQPNYYYASREYFDDYTHVAVYSHNSLGDFLAANGFEVTLRHPRFLPFSIKSRLPVLPPLIRAYLALPWKPFAKQMLFEARPRPE